MHNQVGWQNRLGKLFCKYRAILLKNTKSRVVLSTFSTRCQMVPKKASGLLFLSLTRPLVWLQIKYDFKWLSLAEADAEALIQKTGEKPDEKSQAGPSGRKHLPILNVST